MDKKDIYDFSKQVLIALIIACLLMFFVNQFLGYRYKAVILTNPCYICFTENQEYANIIRLYYLGKNTNPLEAYNITLPDG